MDNVRDEKEMKVIVQLVGHSYRYSKITTWPASAQCARPLLACQCAFELRDAVVAGVETKTNTDMWMIFLLSSSITKNFIFSHS